ncbi:hypothetical protein DEU56DRAFT_233177 [Suillus clintonianus]|uniref:uncharacterized protein n=1 Tax=Suillus clintonianus TaxID=1904413 RepID=UPI001B85EC1B|nr:uncharacterized protein DEU56DRAFT_233177 [Suillus clintonianus]KAG2156382.1 hypothetical protein DEU56DRAFT_233177 [Suillus clintonianus]
MWDQRKALALWRALLTIYLGWGMFNDTMVPFSPKVNARLRAALVPPYSFTHNAKLNLSHRSQITRPLWTSVIIVS